MFAMLAAAALLIDPSAKPGVSPKPVRAVAEATRVAASAPAPAVLAGVAVTLECTARASGRVENCSVLGETHPGLGFGEAAVALMKDAEVAPGPRDVQFARTIQFTP